MPDLLQQMPIFGTLTAEQRGWLLSQGRELMFQAGDVLLQEGEPEREFHIVLSGRLHVTMNIEGQETEIEELTVGNFTGDLGLLIGLTSSMTLRARQPTRVLAFSVETFRHLITISPQVGRAMLSLMSERMQGAESLIREREQLIALGKLSADLAHDLNNPAAAGQRAADQLLTSLRSLQALTLQLVALSLHRQQVSTIMAVIHEARDIAAQPMGDALAVSDQEEVVTNWLDQHNVEDGWRLAPGLVSIGLREEQLNLLAQTLSSATLAPVIVWLQKMLQSEQLAGDIAISAARISALVDAVKDYSHMDQGLQQEIDIHDGLESTLTIMRNKLRDVIVQRDYDRSLPRIIAYGNELNQVWTNIIDNAIDALKSQGDGERRLIIRTRRDGEVILIEFVDNGPGIPPEVQSAIFRPFFTTKKQHGSGLGLDISYRIIVNRHSGDIQVASSPGETRFQVRLPIQHIAC